MTENSEKKREIAEESEKTKKAREKLKKQFELLEKKITKEALNAKRVEIHQWIARHASNRVVLRNKNISLFDENQNAAKQSQRIRGIAEGLQHEMIRWTASIEKPNSATLARFFSPKKSSSSEKEEKSES